MTLDEACRAAWAAGIFMGEPPADHVSYLNKEDQAKKVWDLNDLYV